MKPEQKKQYPKRKCEQCLEIFNVSAQSFSRHIRNCGKEKSVRCTNAKDGCLSLLKEKIL